MKLTFLDGTQRDFPEGITGFEVAKSLSDGLSRAAVGVLLDGIQFDLNHKILSDCEIKILTFDDPEGKDIY